MGQNSTLKSDVLNSNKELPKRGLVLYSWGNVSAIDRQKSIVVIKPAGIAYDRLTEDQLSVADLEGNTLEGPHRPSVDLPIHLVLYQAFPEVKAIVHTHSTYATIWAQSGRDIPCYGTTHADYFFGSIPCASMLSAEEVAEKYEVATGESIVRCFNDRSPLEAPGALAAGHGVFTWGRDVWEAVHSAVVLEEIAHMAFGTEVLGITGQGATPTLPPFVSEKHYSRKHGPDAYFLDDDKGAPR